MMKTRIAFGLLGMAVALAVGGCRTPATKPGAEAAVPASAPLFADVTAAAGITNKHHTPILT
jgi:hypothetical protein